MTCITARKTIPVQFSAIAAGNGYWGMERGFRVDFTEVVVDITCMPDTSWAEVRFVHEHKADGDTGLCYTDKGIEDACNTFIKRHPELRNIIESVSGSEQGMQDELFLSCDGDVVEGLEFDTLKEQGYFVEAE